MTAVNSIAVPSVAKAKSSFGDFAVGAAGGLVYAITRAIFGSGLIGALAAPVLAGSVVKGPRGTALATIAGFMLLSDALSGASAGASAEPTRGTM